MQTLKENIREKILQGALDCFIEKGFKDTTISAISKRCGVSVGNMYNYYKSKDDLFYDVIKPTVVKNVKNKLRQKFESVSGKEATDFAALKDFVVKTDDLVNLLVEYRKIIVVTLAKSQGTKFEDTTDELVQFLSKLFIDYMNSRNVKSALEMDIVCLIYENMLKGISEILEKNEDPVVIKKFLMQFFSYHMNGITGA